MGGASIWHWVVVGGVVLLLFGRGKISEMMGDVAKGIKAFKKGMSDEDASAQPTVGTVPGAVVNPNDPLRTIEHRTAPPTAAAAPASTLAADRKIG